MNDTTRADRENLPGQDDPLEMRYNGEPVTDDEALGVARRIAHLQRAQGRSLTGMGEVDELPAHNAKRLTAAWRLPPRTLFRARARAEMEGATMSEVVSEALKAYADAPPGSRVEYRMPGRGRKV